jgi:BlaI family transcriptional regulator, penicillinase repressor
MIDPVEPSDLEMQILSLLWQRGPLTARQVLEQMPDGKKRAYTTVLSTMQVMEKKRLLAHRVLGKGARGGAHVYRPRVSQGRVLGRLLGKWVNHIFSGNPAAVVQSLLRETPISPEELAEIRRVVAEHTSSSSPSTSDFSEGPSEKEEP